MDGGIVISSSAVTSGTTSAVFVTVPQHSNIIPVGSKASVIQQNQASVIQSPTVQTVQVGKGGGNVILLKSGNSVIQSTPGLQVLETEATDDSDRKHQRQILVRRPSYRKIFNDIAEVDRTDSNSGSTNSSANSNSATESTSTTLTIGGQEFTTANLLKVIPASSLQLGSGGSDSLQTISMSGNTTTAAPGTILQYGTGSEGAQFIVPVGAGDLSSLKFTTAGGITQGVVLAAAAPTNHNSGDSMGEEATRKRDLRLAKNREAARECRAKKKEYIKCLENRVAVLENQNKALIEELKNLKSLYCSGS